MAMLPVVIAKARVVEAIRGGASVVAATAAVDRQPKTYEMWRRDDKAFAAKVDQARKDAKKLADQRDAAANDPALVAALRSAGTGPKIPFAQWRKRYLGYETYPHMQQWVDVLEGNDPQPIEGCEWDRRHMGRLVVNVPPAHAKAMALDTPLMTTHGWSTIGDLRVGDRVFGPDGKPTEVTAKSQVFDKPCFRAVVSDGESFTVSEDHLWTVSNGSRGGRASTLRWETLTAVEMSARGGEWFLPPQEALFFPGAPLPLDPYVLGAWLGDGHTADARLTGADPEIADEFVRAGFSVLGTTNRTGTGRALTYKFGGLFHVLHELGVIGDKHVPEAYLLGSFGQRLALLQGLMDTDGTVSGSGQCTFVNTNRDLTEAVFYLASSLGERPTFREFRTALNGRDCGPGWSASWTPRGGEVVPFRLKRKVARVGGNLDRTRPSTVRLRRLRLEPAETVPTQCIVVDNDSHLFLVGRSLVPTHNSTTLTVDYVAYRICMDPNVRVIIVCKRKEMAQAFLYQIKQRLTSSLYAPLQEAYAPPGGWRPASGEGSFTQNLMYLTGRTGDYKDPTVQAIGMRTQIYGARADLVILDDCIVLDNANEYEKQIQWLESEVMSRIKNGQVLVIGTRLTSTDMYSELRNEDRYLSGKSPWSYLRQPMVLQFADDPAEWKTLWPKSSSPSDTLDEPGPDGLYEAWPGWKAAEIRDSVPPSVWSLVYQQQQTASDATFTPEMVRAVTDRRRKPGPLVAGALGHPATGGEGMWTIASMDPAMAGDTFVLVGKVDRTKRARWIENAWVQGSPSPKWIRDKIEEVTLEYGVNEWVIEEQGFQGFLVHDPEINRFLASRGVRMHGTYTGKEKNDPDFGVASVASLFGTFRRINEGAGRAEHNRDHLIHLPDPDMSQGIKTLAEEMYTWVPGVRGSKLRQDGPMALWFFEQRARVWLGEGRGAQVQTHISIPFLSRGHQARQMTVPATLRGFMAR